MKIIVASQNQVKISAVQEVIDSVSFLASAQLEGVCVESGVSEQPMTFADTVRGAKNRAKAAFSNCDLSIGIESGLMPVPGRENDYINLTVCSVYDGTCFTVGTSQGFLVPPVIIKVMQEKKISLGQAFHHCALTENKKLGSCKGCINILTKGRVTRKDLTRPAVVMALMPFENTDLF